MSVIPWAAPRILQAGSPASALRSQHGPRLAHYQELRDFYDGRHFPAAISTRAPRPAVFNYARAIVDKHVAYLFSRGVTLQSENPTSVLHLAAIARANHLDRLLMQAALNASITGDAVLKITWADDQVRIWNIDPGRFYPTHRGDDPTALREVAVTSAISPQEASERYGITTMRPTAELLETWTPTTLTIDLDATRVLEGPNPYGFIPYVHVPNLAPPNSPFGRSDLEDIIDPNRELDRTLSSQSDSIRFHSDPPVIFKGVREHSDLAVGPGTVWDIPADADVRLLEWSGQVPAVDQHLDRVLRALYDVSESPRSSFGDTEQAFSGVALETQLQPIVQRTLRRRVAWNAALEALGDRALQLADQFTGSDHRPYDTQVIWAPMLPRDDDAEANRHLALTAGALESLTAAMKALGILDPQHELTEILEQRHRLGIETRATPAERGTRFVPPS